MNLKTLFTATIFFFMMLFSVQGFSQTTRCSAGKENTSITTKQAILAASPSAVFENNTDQENPIDLKGELYVTIVSLSNELTKAQPDNDGNKSKYQQLQSKRKEYCSLIEKDNYTELTNEEQQFYLKCLKHVDENKFNTLSSK